jgi:hypothetical protein
MEAGAHHKFLILPQRTHSAVGKFLRAMRLNAEQFFVSPGDFPLLPQLRHIGGVSVMRSRAGVDRTEAAWSTTNAQAVREP